MAAPEPVIFLVDMDAFFVAVERMEDPALAGVPVVVGGSVGGRGVVAAASYEARRFGVHSAMPMATARRLCPCAVYIQADHAKYAAASERVLEVLHRFSPQVEPVSVDEAYVDMTGTERLHGPPLATAHALREAIAREVHCPASIGVASNKLVAKVAADLAKPAGILRVYPGREALFLSALPVGKLPGVGKVGEAELKGVGVRTVGDLAKLPLEWLEGRFKSWGRELYRKARGISEDAVEPPGEP
ncbi:MAG: DNA polymerase IV, partial [Nitrospinota bacterium]